MINICASIPAENPESLRDKINRAFSFGANYIEIRFDFLDLSDMEESLKIAENIREKAIFTLRTPEEGGKFKANDNDRIEWLKKLAMAKPMLLDIEYSTIQSNDDLANYCKTQKIPVLLSWHDFEKTPPKDQLRYILEKMRVYSNHIKMVTTAINIVDALRILDLYENAAESNLIAFSMGEAGIISRIMCTIIGRSPFTYAALEESIAPGQLTVVQMREIYDKISPS
ncbi:MAG TPA: type I 3-dehydroquinate dehydratase [Nitrososphaeraceae archaeon]|nr:type I 3-dehydroquinate dehydratase [Nitrososphaeraceae archaeon]